MKYNNHETLYILDVLPVWIELYNDSASSTQIAKQFLVNPTTVIDRLRKANVIIRTKSSTKLDNLNPRWRGDSVGYGGLHDWVKRRLQKPELCTECHIRRAFDLANISQKYKRELSDWEWLCRKCHMIKDGRIANLKQNKTDHV